MIEELENKYVEELEEAVRTRQAKLTALTQTASKPWRHSLKDYTVGRLVHFEAVMDNPVFSDLPEKVRSSLVEEVSLDEGWEYLKAFPLPSRTRKRLMASSNWL